MVLVVQPVHAQSKPHINIVYSAGMISLRHRGQLLCPVRVSCLGTEDCVGTETIRHWHHSSNEHTIGRGNGGTRRRMGCAVHLESTSATSKCT